MTTTPSPTTNRSSVSDDVFVMGLPFWNADYDEFRTWWQGVLDEPESRGIVVAFANANTLNHAATNPSFRQALENVDVRINDGIGFRIASKMRGVETRANLNGTDLVPRLFGDAPRPVKVFVYGSTEESNAGAAAALERRFPQVQVVGRVDGYVPTEAAIQKIRESSADVVLVALGHPRQETFCVDYRDALGAKVLLPIGGLVDFLSETKPRAPLAVRRLGMEWAYRLALEPRRMFVRYVVGNPVFLVRSAVHARRDRARKI